VLFEITQDAAEERSASITHDADAFHKLNTSDGRLTGEELLKNH
jgi:hypothetical protein